MWAPNSSPYSKSNSSWPLFSTGIASLMPRSLISSGTLLGPPNCSSTSPPVTWASAPRSSATTSPSKIRCLPSEMRSASSGLGWPSIPKRLTNDPRWSNARM